MKKLFQEDRWKQHLAKRSEREIQKRSKFNNARKRQTQRQARNRPSYKHTFNKDGKAIVSAPICFDLQNNTDETLSFFNDIHQHVTNHREIFVDLVKVEQLSTEVVAYMLSMIEHAKQRGNRSKISGNSPREPKCNELFRKSGFYKYVFSTPRAPLHDPDVFAIESGPRVVPIKAFQIKKFVTDKLLTMQSIVGRDLYETIIECMANPRWSLQNRPMVVRSKPANG